MPDLVVKSGLGCLSFGQEPYDRQNTPSAMRFSEGTCPKRLEADY
jgi:hypothetical protein